MADYEVGYGKTPKGTRFQPGISGNPKGRPRRGADPLGEVVQGFLEATVDYRRKGRKRTASLDEVRLRKLRSRAIKGDVGAADLMLQELRQARKSSRAAAIRLLVTDCLPDSPGQTVDDKMAAVAGGLSGQPARSRSARWRGEQAGAPTSGEEQIAGEGA